MKILGLFVARSLPGESEAFILAQAFNLGDFSYFQRGSIKEFATFFAKTLGARVPPGQRSSVEHQEYVCHVHVRTNKLAFMALCDQEYPARVAFTLLAKVNDDFNALHPQHEWEGATQELPFPELEQTLTKYQNPAEADSIMRMEKDLDETKIILHKTIDSVLERGVKLDSLVDKSNDLSVQSKMFYKTAKSQNSCCYVM
mmetsp:Transcript_12410/g.37864  ORF Transcript_12410/g.37864 Transcript_12410/m.37864 type:complete len:200 (+) Transcript_12410:150-749(+)